MTSCPACTAFVGEPFLVRRNVPVHQNLVMATQEAALAVTRGDLEMVCCEGCGFVFNRAFDAGLLAYGDDYDNTQSHSPSFRAYMDELIRHLLEDCGVRDARIVEVGCGKGYFIRELVAADTSNVGWGFDPSYLGEEVVLDRRLEYRREFYGPGCESIRADVVVCRHVIEHVADPHALLTTVRSALALSPRARVFFETPELGWILRNRVSWDLFYEHCSLFTPGSLRTVFEHAGFEVDQVMLTFGDQYMWLEARLGEATTDALTTDAGNTPRLAREFAEAEAEWQQGWSERLAASTGKVAIWGAGAKGVTFANLVDPRNERIDCVVDVNPRKQGQFLPGTGHAIVAPEALGTRGVKRAILMNPNYRSENVELLRAAGLAVELEE